MKKNVPMVGFVIGLFLPILGFLLVNFIFIKGGSIGSVIESLSRSHRDAAKVITLSILINLLPFLYFMKKRLDYTMNGVVVATMLYAVFIVLLMFVW